MICGMLHVGITAANLDRSAAFYRDVLRFPCHDPDGTVPELMQLL